MAERFNVAKLLNYKKCVEVDHSRDCVLLQKEISAGDPCRLKAIFSKPAKNPLAPNEADRIMAVDVAYNYVLNKMEEHTDAEENVRRAIFSGAFYMGMCAMATLTWFLGYLN